MEGTSFAIPINKVMGIVDDLSEGKRITHGYLGKLDDMR
jgi:S1-C subfamily serine protease